MNIIQLQKDITPEQYEMAVRALDLIGIEVATENTEEDFVLSDEQKKILDSGRKDRSGYIDVDMVLKELKKEYGL